MQEEIIELQPQDLLNDMFSKGSTATGEEELLRLGASFARQVRLDQMKTIIFLLSFAQKSSLRVSKILNLIVEKYLEMKQFHRSDIYVMRMFESLALRRFINENSVKVNVQK